MQYQLTTTIAKDGSEIYILERNNEKFRLNSSYAPIAEAEKFAWQYQSELEMSSVVCVFGHGNGMFYSAFRALSNEKTKFVIWEPCREIIAGEKVFENAYIVVSKERFCEKILETINHSNYENVLIIVLPKYKQLFEEEYYCFAEFINRHVNKLRSQIATARHFGHKGVKNNIRNMRYLANSYCIDSYKGVFPIDMPVFIVASGPSLEKNIHLLKNVKGKALILCVDTAAKYMVKKGIFPDFIVSVDPNICTSFLEDDRLKGEPMIGCSDMNYEIVDCIKSEKLIFASTENEIYKNLYKKSNHDIPSLKSGGSVSTFTYMLCRYLGCRIIVLLGQDLALQDGQRYAGTNQDPKDINRELILVEAIDGSKVYTTQDYYMYLQWFEKRIAEDTNVKVIDATEGGAKISGCINMTLEDAIEKYVNQDEDVNKYINEIKPAFNAQEKPVVVSAMDRCRYNLLGFQKQLNNCIIKLKSICADWNLSKWSLLNRDISDIFACFDVLEEGFLVQREIDATVLAEYLPVVEKINNWKGNRNNIQYCELILQYFCFLNSAVDRIIEIFE